MKTTEPTRDIEKQPPFFSIILPIYNCDKTLERCFDSILTQSFGNYEVIAVDDASLDDSWQVMKKYAEKDARIKLCKLNVNSKQEIALKAGVAESAGKYVMFVDADDELLPGALERLYEDAEREWADILHFPLDVSADPAVDIERVKSFFVPYCGRLNGAEEILRGCYEEKKFNWNVVNKIYNGDLCRQVMGDIPEIHAQRGNDLYIFTHLAAASSSYVGLPDPGYYVYHYGEGQDGDKDITLSELESFCESSLYSRALHEEIGSGVLPSFLAECVDGITDRLIDNCVQKMVNFVPADKWDEGMRILTSIWGYEGIALSLLRNGFRDKQHEVARLFSATNLFEGEGEPSPTHVAAYYRSCEGGGVENVLRELSEIWHDSGKKITWFLEEAPLSEVPDYIDVVLVPKASEWDAPSMKARFDVLRSEVATRGIEALVYHQWLNTHLIWDMIAVKCGGACSLTVHCHGNFTNQMRFGLYYFSRMPAVYSLADAVVVINPVDEKFWGMFNPRVCLTENPIPAYLGGAAHGTREDMTVLWMARLSPEKHPEKAIEVFSKVHEKIREARFVLAGSTDNRDYENSLRKAIRDAGLDDYVEMPGWCNEEKKNELLSRSSVFLMTSEAREGYPVTLIEAKAAGLPIVMFDLPYLSVLQSPEGISVSKQGDSKGCALQICSLLEDSERWGDEARRSLSSFQQLRSFDQAAFWDEVFFSASRARGGVSTDGLTMVMWDTLFDSYIAGLDVWSARCKEAERAKCKAQDDSKRLRSSKAWKLGNRLMRIPRAIRRLVKGIGKQ